jgi:flagellar biosynthetic protein FliO
MGAIAIALATALELVRAQAAGPSVPLPPESAWAPLEAPAAAPPASPPRIVPPPQEPPGARKIADRPEPGPSLGGFVFWSLFVLALLTGAFVLLRRLTRGSRFLGGGGVIQVLARKALGQRQEIFLVEIGTKVLVVGSTRDHLTALGEFAGPDDVAVLRASLPASGGSMKAAFRESLSEGLREAEEPAGDRLYDSIAGELAQIRRTVKAWRA